MIKKILTTIIAGFFSFSAISDEGMWLPHLLKTMN